MIWFAKESTRKAKRLMKWISKVRFSVPAAIVNGASLSSTRGDGGIVSRPALSGFCLAGRRSDEHSRSGSNV